MFIDDFNMPEKEIFGAQPPLEILRQWMQYDFWYDLKKQTAKRIVDTKVVAGMGHPGGGRTFISARTLHKFHILNMTFPERAQPLYGIRDVGWVEHRFGADGSHHCSYLRAGEAATLSIADFPQAYGAM